MLMLLLTTFALLGSLEVSHSQLTNDWFSSYLGCYVDAGNRDLPLQSPDMRLLDTEACIDYCFAREYEYAGTQFSVQCFCGHSYGRHGKAKETDCNRQCPGDSDEYCGGVWRNSIYKTGYVPEIYPAPCDDPAYVGCYIDTSNRDLNQQSTSMGSLTTEACGDFCFENGFEYFGTQFRDQCYCGHSFGRHGKANEAECNLPCRGNSEETCGGTWRNSVYRTAYLGCYIDTGNRDLPVQSPDMPNLTNEACAKYCFDRGYEYSGTQFSVQCFCGHNFGRRGKASERDCYRECPGNSRQKCGGVWRNSVSRTGFVRAD